MKIYIQDHGWRGCIVVIANNEKEARDLMVGCYNYEAQEEVEEQEIKIGHVHENLGDT